MRDAVWYKAGYGQHDANWLAFYDFFREHCGLVAETEKLAGLSEIAQSAGWFWPLEKVCLVTDRPVHLARDARGRLHCASRAAIEYPDGWGVYAWHGVRVPDWVILQPDLITIEKIDAEQNAEIRRVMLERYGFARFMKDAGAEILDHDERFGTLFRRNIAGDEPIVMIEVVNRTPEGLWQPIEGALSQAEVEGFGLPTLRPAHGKRFVPQLKDGALDFKRYMLRVDPNLRPLPAGDWSDERKREWMRDQRPQEMTARNAVASTFGRRGEDYAPTVES